MPGGAGNAARNVATLGGTAFAVGLCGDDDAGDRLRALLQRDGIDMRGAVRVRHGHTWRKTRFTAGDLHTVQQQVMRLDQEPHYPEPEVWRAALHAALVERVLDAARAVALPMDREVLHVLPQEFIVDDQDGIREPVGMSRVRLEARVHIVTGAVSAAHGFVSGPRFCRLCRFPISFEDPGPFAMGFAEGV